MPNWSVRPMVENLNQIHPSMVTQGMSFTLKSLPDGIAGRSSPFPLTQVRNPLILNPVCVDRISRSIGPVTGEHEISFCRTVRDFLLPSRHPRFSIPRIMTERLQKLETPMVSALSRVRECGRPTQQLPVIGQGDLDVTRRAGRR